MSERWERIANGDWVRRDGAHVFHLNAIPLPYYAFPPPGNPTRIMEPDGNLMQTYDSAEDAMAAADKYFPLEDAE